MATPKCCKAYLGHTAPCLGPLGPMSTSDMFELELIFNKNPRLIPLKGPRHIKIVGYRCQTPHFQCSDNYLNMSNLHFASTKEANRYKGHANLDIYWVSSSSKDKGYDAQGDEFFFSVLDVINIVTSLFQLQKYYTNPTIFLPRNKQSI